MVFSKVKCFGMKFICSYSYDYSYMLLEGAYKDVKEVVQQLQNNGVNATVAFTGYKGDIYAKVEDTFENSQKYIVYL